ncbi:hypothetical protein [Burkholderia ubonensis]|uniref:hypothetical protein n=1 Tax=Burkholderia ubonensis TaxID=101571 RepID=UPI001160F9A5|nr:hypothetical protein [Burkholderia ubonensis]
MIFSKEFQGRVGLLILGLALAAALIAIGQQLYQGQLLTAAGFSQRISLKILTYHQSNISDREISTDALLASRGFVYFLVALCIGAVGACTGLGQESIRRYMVAYLVLVSILLFCVFYYSEEMAFYTFG